jgi:menaquinone-dependent protoporphyrinogen oxidase
VDPDLVTDVAGYDAIVLGSAVYAGRWLKPARELARRLEGHLAGKPVWLFSSGPVGDAETPPPVPADATEWTRRLNAREHQVFAGRLAQEQLGFGERMVIRIVGAPSRDDRPWIAIGRWALSIAAALRTADPAIPHATKPAEGVAGTLGGIER